MKNDITTSEDIKLLVDSFYNKAKLDDTIGYVFNDAMQVNWDEHLPKMYGFWEILLLGKEGLQSNPMQKHIEINQKEKLTEAHFNQWVNLWHNTIDELFEGKNADLAKERTKFIKQTLLQRIRISETNSQA